MEFKIYYPKLNNLYKLQENSIFSFEDNDKVNSQNFDLYKFFSSLIVKEILYLPYKPKEIKKEIFYKGMNIQNYVYIKNGYIYSNYEFQRKLTKDEIYSVMKDIHAFYKVTYNKNNSVFVYINYTYFIIEPGQICKYFQGNFFDYVINKIGIYRI